MRRPDVFVWSNVSLCLLILCQFVDAQPENNFARLIAWIGSPSVCGATAAAAAECARRASACTGSGHLATWNANGVPIYCISCIGGFIQTGNANTLGSCSRCPMHTYRPRDSFNRCEKCPTQAYTTQNTMVSLDQCLFPNDHVVSTPVSNSIQSMECINDGWSQIHNTDGSKNCARCMYGHHDAASDDMVTCSPCPLNTFRQDGSANTCVPCSAQHLSHTASKTCMHSGVIRGDYANVGSCIGGMKMTDASVSTMDPVCEDCPKNTYRAEGTPNTCLPCPASTPSSYIRSSSLSACQVPPCASGTYRKKLNNGEGSQCVACPQQYTAIALTQAAQLVGQTTPQCIQFV